MKTSEKIVQYLEKKEKVTAKQLSSYLEITPRATFKQLSKLIKNQEISKIGISPKVFYVPIQKNTDKKGYQVSRIARSMIGEKQQNLIIYQGKTGKIEFRGDFNCDTVWGSLDQISRLFGVQKAAISKHFKNIYNDGELNRLSTVSKMEIVQSEGGRRIRRKIKHYNLDAIISVGYRVNSKQATKFRIWATNVLKKHLIDGYTINKKRVGASYQKFMQAVTDIKVLLPSGDQIKSKDVLELIGVFAETWLSLDSYDTNKLPRRGVTKKQVYFHAKELEKALYELKQDLINKKQATKLFGQERDKDPVKGIVGNIFQSFDKKDLYSTVEEKAAHLLYFMVKNHPFVDGNKRSGAFAFVWFLRKTGILRTSLNPEVLTVLTLLVAESNPKDKNRIVRLIILLLKK